MKKVRYGIVGVGNMGSAHAKSIVEDKARDFSLAAVCDLKPQKQALADELGAKFFTDYRQMYDSGLIDAVIIATPHYWHTPQTLAAARKGIHVLCEKPLSSTVGDARLMVAECRKNKVALGVVLHHRTRAVMIKMKQLVDSGRIGEVFRVSMVCSNWFRTQAYYDSGDWRGTWDGEGGGVLINQAPHHLDLFQWIGGMPRRLTAVVNTRAHKIEVEDTANVICEYGNGKVGYIYATTAEEPGMEQFIISGDKATLAWDGGKLRIGRLKLPVSRHIFGSRNSSAGVGKADQAVAWEDVEIKGEPGGKHIMVIRAFAKHVLTGKGFPYATGEQAVGELELSNAAYISGYRNKAVDLPVDAAEMDKLMDKLIRERCTGRGGNLRAEARKHLRQLGVK